MQTGSTRRRIAAGIALAAIAALVTGAGLAAQGRGGPSPFHGALRHLDLTDAQRESIRAAVREHRENGAAQRRELRTALRELRDATMAEVVNETAIRALAANAAPLQADAAVRRAHLNAAVLAVLTTQQRIELRELQENARENRRARPRDRRRTGD